MYSILRFLLYSLRTKGLQRNSTMTFAPQDNLERCKSKSKQRCYMSCISPVQSLQQPGHAQSLWNTDNFREFANSSVSMLFRLDIINHFSSSIVEFIECIISNFQPLLKDFQEVCSRHISGMMARRSFCWNWSGSVHRFILWPQQISKV